MLKVIVAGAAGRMGKQIIKALSDDDRFVLKGAFESPDHPAIGQDAGLLAGVGLSGVIVEDSFEKTDRDADVLIDFTTPEATLKNVRVAKSRNLAMVIGTTGFSDDILHEITGIVSEIKCVMAPNMSVGVNVMFKIAGELAKILGNDYDMEIIEAHHNLKKDAPSGTALRLADVLAGATGRDLESTAVYCRKGIIGERDRDEIGIQVIRGGDITGEHTVMFAGTGERIELIHRAHNRGNFARGALRAALWVVKQPEGLYDMQDVLGLKDL